MVVTKIDHSFPDFSSAEAIGSLDELNARVQTLFKEGRIGCIDIRFNDGSTRIVSMPGLKSNLLKEKGAHATGICYTMNSTHQIAVSSLESAAKNCCAQLQFLGESKEPHVSMYLLN